MLGLRKIYEIGNGSIRELYIVVKVVSDNIWYLVIWNRWMLIGWSGDCIYKWACFKSTGWNTKEKVNWFSNKVSVGNDYMINIFRCEKMHSRNNWQVFVKRYSCGTVPWGEPKRLRMVHWNVSFVVDGTIDCDCLALKGVRDW